jgi:NSS family neurotransmitter:Na+ symporter
VHVIGERNPFASFDYLATNWLLPLSAIGIALFTGWVLFPRECREEYLRGASMPDSYATWRGLIQFAVPLAVAFVFLRAVGIL